MTTDRHPSPEENPAIRLVETKLSPRFRRAASEAISTPQNGARVLKELIGHADRENFAILHLNSRNQITHAHIVAIGTLNGALVHPREVFKAAVLANAGAILVGHNHPSGEVLPSGEDLSIVARLREAGTILGIPVLDAFIVGPCDEFHADSIGSVTKLHPPSDQDEGPT